MAPIFYVEIRNQQQDFKNGKPTGNYRTLVTRYYTEFNPNPDSFMAKLNGATDSEDPNYWAGIESTKIKKTSVDPVTGNTICLRPRSIEIESGNWDVRMDWRESWEEFEDDSTTESILGLTLYNVSKTHELPTDRVNTINLSANMWGDNLNNTAHFQKLGVTRERTRINGTVIGQVAYSSLLTAIKANTSVVDCQLTYSRATNTTAVSITLEDTDDA